MEQQIKSKYFNYFTEEEKSIYETATYAVQGLIRKRAVGRFQFIENLFLKPGFAKYGNYELYVLAKFNKDIAKRKLYQINYQKNNKQAISSYMSVYNKKKYNQLDSTWRLSRDISVELYESKKKIEKKTSRLLDLEKRKSDLEFQQKLIKSDIEHLKQKIEIIEKGKKLNGEG